MITPPRLRHSDPKHLVIYRGDDDISKGLKTIFSSGTYCNFKGGTFAIAKLCLNFDKHY